jgi:hypothetical protein
VVVEGFDDPLVAGGFGVPAAAFDVVFQRSDVVELGAHFDVALTLGRHRELVSAPWYVARSAP